MRAARPSRSGPASASPRRRAGSVRRTSHVDVGPDGVDGWEQPGPVPLRVEAGARDLHTPPRDGETTTQAATASLRARLAGDRRLERLSTSPDTDTAAVVGRTVGSGFRAAALPALVAPSAPLGQLLRDLPTAVLISGYAHIRSRTAAGTPPGRLMPTGVLDEMTDLCSGWRAGGTMARSIAAGEGIPLQDCPPAPTPLGGDPEGWHPVPPLSAGWMRRRRRVDVVRMGDELVVDAMFRDTHADRPDGEVVLHEYALAAWFDAATLRMHEISAIPRVVPFPECPWAADNLDALVEVPAGELRAAADSRLSGTVGCTHLNDLIASVADLPALRPDGA